MTMIKKQTLYSKFNFESAGKEVLHCEREALRHLEQYINESFTQACHLILSCDGKVVVMGMGKSGHIGQKIAATFASTGTPAFFVHPAEASHGDLGMISHQDVVIAISNSGESAEILALLPVLKRLKIRLISMGSRRESTMGQNADVHLCIKVPQEACPLGLAPTCSSTATLVMGDALAIALLRARGFTSDDFALSHPGGALGRRLLLHIKDIMHKDDAIPCVLKTASIQETLLEITQKRMGMVAIVDEEKHIQGVFTDGDLRRIFDTDISFQNTPISQVMTTGGIRVDPEMLAVEALNIMQEKQITSIMVEKENQLIGVVHLHDMLRAGVV